VGFSTAKVQSTNAPKPLASWVNFGGGRGFLRYLLRGRGLPRRHPARGADPAGIRLLSPPLERPVLLVEPCERSPRLRSGVAPRRESPAPAPRDTPTLPSTSNRGGGPAQRPGITPKPPPPGSVLTPGVLRSRLDVGLQGKRGRQR